MWDQREKRYKTPVTVQAPNHGLDGASRSYWIQDDRNKSRLVHVCWLVRAPEPEHSETVQWSTLSVGLFQGMLSLSEQTFLSSSTPGAVTLSLFQTSTLMSLHLLSSCMLQSPAAVIFPVIILISLVVFFHLLFTGHQHL